MTFFYDMNERLAEIAKNQTSTQPLKEDRAISEKMYFDPATGQTTDRTFNTVMKNQQFQADLDKVKSSLYMEPGDPKVYSRERGLAPGIAARRLEAGGVDIPGLVGNRPNPATLDAGPGLDEDLREMMRLSGLSEDDMEEGNEFSGARADAMAAGEKTFAVDGRTYPVKEGVAESERQPGRFSGAWQILVNGKKVLSFRGQIDQETANRIGVVKAADRGLYNPGSGDKIKIVPVMLDQKQGVAEGKGSKPDFLDVDKDDNRKESFKKAVKDAKGRKIAGRAYGGAAQKDDAEDHQEQPRRRGRPDEGGPKHTYDEPFGRVEVPAWKGSRTVHKIGDAEPGKEAPRRGRPKKVREADDQNIDIVDRGEYDREGDMALDQLYTIIDAAKELQTLLSKDENLPEWVQSKITKAQDYIDTARDYIKSQGSDMAEPIAERPRSENQRIAAAIALKAKREGHRPEPGTASAQMASMSEKELEKFAKKPKGEKLPKRVKETTTSGSVAVSDAAPDKKAKGGMSFGKGIYDSWNRELEVMIAESMDISVNQSTQDDGSIKKTINVNATDEDAEKLADLLNLAGMEQHDHMHDEDHACPVCGQDPCECAEMVDENSPNWPTNTEFNDDAFQYSGGLNGPKTTGQTTTPVIASQLDRQMSESSQPDYELARMKLLLGK